MTQQASLELLHLAANCNPKPYSVQFINNSTLAYTFSNQIAVYNVKDNAVMGNINDRSKEHARVNCIEVFSILQKHFIVAGYDSGVVIGYASTDLTHWNKEFEVTLSSSILTISILLSVKNGIHFFIATNEASIHHFIFDGSKLIQKSKIAFPLNRIIECICPIEIDGRIGVFIGGVDQKIHAYKVKEEGFHFVCSMVGHENAITRLTISKHMQKSIENSQTEDYSFLASSSKDGYIRLWRITNSKNIPAFHKNIYQLFDHRIYLQSVLISHESSVTSLLFTQFSNALQLVSCSLDCTICVWEEEANGWNVAHRMGQFLGNKNAYFQIAIDPSNKYLLAVNYIGSALIWHFNASNSFSLIQSFNGHSNKCTSAQFSTTGAFLVSTSKDQTSRILARNHLTSQFHQISRAQTHGYDINAITTVKVADNVIDLVVCGADQKVIRVVEPPASFANYLNTFTLANLHLYFNSQQQQKKYILSKGDQPLLYQTYAEGGTQVLGLMTKMHRVQKQKISTYYDDEEMEELPQDNNILDKGDAKVDFTVPPHEDYLVKHTLWPEMNKLYGHPHQIQYLARNNENNLLASCCSALNKQAASIIIWESKQWKIKHILQFHQYSVYALGWSAKDTYFASAGKDRKLAIYDGKTFALLNSSQPHARAITSLSFNSDETLLATGSRDKSIKLHSPSKNTVLSQLSLKHVVTALQFSPSDASLLAVGLQNGSILLIRVDSEHKMKVVHEICDWISPTMAINSIKWNGNLLAVCSDDFSLRIYQVNDK